MNKNIVLGVIGVLVVAGASFYFFTKPAEQKVYHVGILSGVDGFATIGDGFKQKMTELGYVEGKNITYDVQKLNPDLAAYKKVLKKFVDDKDDLIFAFPTEPAVEAKAAVLGTSIPVVFALGAIEDINLVDSVRTPGGNITGVRYPSPELAVARFDLLRQLMPNLKRLWLVYDVNYPATKSAIRVLRPAAAAAGVTLVEDYVSNTAELKAALERRAALPDIGVDAILIMPENVAQSPDGWPLMSAFAAAHKLPIAGSAAFEADAGAVFAYIADNMEMGSLAAPLADKIFKGIPAGAIPVVTPQALLRLNYPLAQKLGLTISDNFLRRVDEIIR